MNSSMRHPIASWADSGGKTPFEQAFCAPPRPMGRPERRAPALPGTFRATSLRRDAASITSLGCSRPLPAPFRIRPWGAAAPARRAALLASGRRPEPRRGLVRLLLGSRRAVPGAGVSS
jgi:hypothetical protein